MLEIVNCPYSHVRAHTHTRTHTHTHTHTDSSFADVRFSLLDGKQSSNGAVEIQDDPLTKRDSYASFRGGYDSGMPGDDPPDLIK